jgi:hypothetical protein
VKGEFIAVKSLRDWTNVLERWYDADGPGAWPDAKAADEVNASADLQSCEPAEDREDRAAPQRVAN